MRIVFITVGTFFVLGFLKVLFYFLNSWALQSGPKNVQPFPFFEGLKRPFITMEWDSVEADKADVLWVNVVRAQDETLLVTKNSGETLSLKQFLLDQPHRRLILNITENKYNIHLQLEKVILETNAKDRLLIQSDFNPVIVSLKGRVPELVFGSTPADLTRLRAYQFFGLLGFANFPGDAFVMPLKYRNVETLDPELQQILQKFLKKKIILGPLSTKDEVDQALRLDADGLVLTDPTLSP